MYTFLGYFANIHLLLISIHSLSTVDNSLNTLDAYYISPEHLYTLNSFNNCLWASNTSSSFYSSILISNLSSSFNSIFTASVLLDTFLSITNLA